ncbi:hypothetical protein CKO35_08820 [Ectothiorhodospira shaposhnikovii]|uniref:alpha/beta hydrolase n=1 Tax=Ectothiorhodospira shaposhnikovii TaxID=1054 RepID=UPI00190793B2|nr:alpha/beta-hydrolase family protein [Ectothiorhodospira shaposhnikovii]MBK1673410.1 hypothetical protein [Ectothiorhodospira shaposhnikovii]
MAKHKIRDFILDLARGFSVVGLLVGTLFFAFSLTPSLVPRPFGIQGLISGLSFTAGYAVGFFFRWLWIYVELPVPRRRNELILKSLAALACAVVVVTFLWQATEWQNTLRGIMGMEPIGGMPTVAIGLMTLLIFTALLVVARLFKYTFFFLSSRLQRFVPAHVSHVVGVLVAAMLFWSLIDGVIFSLALRAADNSYQQVDALIQDDLARPEDPLKTGSSASLIPWAELGRQGRNFISSGPSAGEIADFTGAPALEPIRVYVGLNAADTARERARLALEELKRVGGFERSVLLLVTPTGTGWVDPAAQDTVEYLHRGDIATVTAQYSYLPSALSLIVEGEYGAEMARALFEKVYGYWTGLPRDARPALYLHGLSLGALNSDRSFDVYDIIQDPFHGALWSGPPFRSETWRKATQERDPDSPPWLPRFRDGAVVRFMNQTGGLNDGAGPWGTFRIAYLQYASDPVTFFDTHAFFREPEWMLQPRGPDVSPDLRWYPIVTMLQLAADMAVGSTPPGYGHTFAAEHYIDAWHALTEPGGWSAEDLERLKTLFSR